MKIGLNIGSGQRPFEKTHEVRWLNIDSQEKWNPDIIADGSDLGHGFPCESVDYVVLHHVLEHFGCGEGRGLIREAHRVLKPGGSLIVCVPDMMKLVDGWKEGKIDTQIFMTNVYGAYMGDEADRHKWGFDRDSLWELLGKFNWKVMFHQTREIPPGADIARDWWILEVECVK